MNYRFRLNFEFKNKFKYIIFTIPQNNQYQKINKLVISKKNRILIDNKNLNKLILFSNKKNLSSIISFDLTCLKIKKKIDSSFSLKQYKNYSIYNNRFINGNDMIIKNLTKKIIRNETNLKLIVNKLYNFTLSYLQYGKPTDYLYDYKISYLDRITDCGGFSTFLGSLFQSINIPTRLIVGFLIKKNLLKNIISLLNLNSYNFSDLSIHAWLEILLPNNSWYPLDPSIEWKRLKKLSKRQGGNGYIPNDRLVVSYGCDHKIKINNKYYKFSIFQKPIYL